MQINTLSPDGPGHRGGPLPAASAAPPGAAYSGILECPCTTRVVKNVSAGTINGRPFRPNCTRDAHTSDLYAKGNPTCDVSTYVGGMECCKDGDVLLDADARQPPHAVQPAEKRNVRVAARRLRVLGQPFGPSPFDCSGRLPEGLWERCRRPRGQRERRVQPPSHVRAPRYTRALKLVFQCFTVTFFTGTSPQGDRG